MNGFDRLKEQVKDQEDMALQETVKYLLSRQDMEQAYLKEDKSLEGMCKFIKDRGQKHCRNGWNYITNEVVFAWAIMYYSLPNSLLKIKSTKSKNTKTKGNPTTSTDKNNVISIDTAKKKIEKEKTAQLSLFGGAVNE